MVEVQEIDIRNSYCSNVSKQNMWLKSLALEFKTYTISNIKNNFLISAKFNDQMIFIMSNSSHESTILEQRCMQKHHKFFF